MIYPFLELLCRRSKYDDNLCYLHLQSLGIHGKCISIKTLVSEELYKIKFMTPNLSMCALNTLYI